MNVFKKLVSVRESESSDRKSEVSDSSSTTRKAKLSRFRLKMRMMSSLGMAGMVTGTKANTVSYENTYKTSPDDNRRFSQPKAEQIIYRYGIIRHIRTRAIHLQDGPLLHSIYQKWKIQPLIFFV